MRGTMQSFRVGPAGWLVAAIACAVWPAAYVAEHSRAAARHLVIVTLDSAVAPLTLPAHTSLFTGLIQCSIALATTPILR